METYDTKNIDKVTSAFIEEIRKKAQPSILRTIQKIISLNREAIYRRLRGEVAFSYVEAMAIAKELKISLDKINMVNMEDHLFKMNNYFDILSEKGYLNSLGPYYMLSQQNNNDNNASIYSVQSTIPLVFLLKYKNLSKLRYYKWMYENTNLDIYKCRFAEISTSIEFENRKDEIIKMIQNFNYSIILPELILENLIKDIQHFTELGVFNNDEIKSLKEDLLKLIDDFEEDISLGKLKNGGDLFVYLSNTNIDTNFGFIELASSQQFAFNKMFGMNYGVSSSSDIYEMYKYSFKQMKNYTTLISQSSPLKRISFFETQRKLINKSINVLNN